MTITKQIRHVANFLELEDGENSVKILIETIDRLNLVIDSIQNKIDQLPKIEGITKIIS